MFQNPSFCLKPRTTRRLFILLTGLILVSLLISPAYAIGQSPSSTAWVINALPGPGLPFNPKKAQCFLNNNDWSAALLTDSGAIQIWTLSNGDWVESSQLSHPGISFTTFQIQDVNNDKSPEIIAGTSDPGFIDVFEYNDGHWVLNSSEKYVWSSVVNLSVGKFDETGTNYILVQNQDGYLFLFAKSGDVLDLVWKSPAVWRFFESAILRDVDGDHRDEMVVSYQNGGVAIIKMVNKAMVSVWENFLWGKVVTFTAGDWDNDGLPEIIFSTTQKVIYFLGYGGSGFQFEAQVSQFGFTPEQLAFRSFPDRRELLAADTSGKFHILSCDLKTKKWQENAASVTGRIAKVIVNPNNQDIYLWAYNQTSSNLEIINPKDMKLKYLDREYAQNPPAVYINNQWYISPRALSNIGDLGLSFQITKTVYKISNGPTLIEVLLKAPNIVKINGNTNDKLDKPYFFNNEIYLTATIYRQLFNLDITVNLAQRDIEIVKLLP